MGRTTRTREETAMMAMPVISFLEEKGAILMMMVMTEMAEMVLEEGVAPGEIEEGVQAAATRELKEGEMTSGPW